MKRDISIYLKDILENIKLIEKFVNKMSYNDFANDKKKQIMQLYNQSKLLEKL